MKISQIITGERLQSIADVYIGTKFYFNYNPYIAKQCEKHKDLSDFQNGEPYQNPRIVFCYTDLIRPFSEIIHLFMNPFVLITHNSDENVVISKPEVMKIVKCDKLIRWHTQNLKNPNMHKLHFLPIGIANKQWPHGNLSYYEDLFSINLKKIKNKDIFMNFKIQTNPTARLDCLNAISNRIPFLEMTNPQNNLFRMAEYKFCICPEGNGMDTHRLWECFYLRVVPILLKSEFSQHIQTTTKLPMVLLDKWEDLFVDNPTSRELYVLQLPSYESFTFDSESPHLTMHHYMKQIIS